MRIVLAFGLCVGVAGLAGCSNPTSNDAAAASSADSNAAAAAPAHNWDYKDGLEYGYTGTLSDDDKKAGKAVADVTIIRYMGEDDGIYTLSSADGLTTASCANPCQGIKIGDDAQRVTFNPNSIIGEAFTDAFNGQLEVYRDAEREGAASADAYDALASEPPTEESAVAPMNK